MASDPQRCLVYFRGEFLYFFIPTCFSFIQLPLCISLYTQCPVVTNTLKIWFQFRQCFGFKDFSITSPICKNHLFLPGQLDSVFSQWQQLGLVKFSDLFINYVFAPFSTLSSNYKLPRSHFFLDIFKFDI